MLNMLFPDFSILSFGSSSESLSLNLLIDFSPYSFLTKFSLNIDDLSLSVFKSSS
jgi:hypothetical protein